MSGQYDDFSREDLILALHQSEDEIQELHQKVELAERKKAGAGADASAVMEIAELNEQVEDQQEKIDKYLADISKLKDSLTEANANMKIAQDEKVDVESKLRDATKRVDALEKDILDATNKSKTSEQQSKEASKQKSETVRETKRLYEENDHLREENKHLEEIVKQLEEHHNMIEGLLVKQSDEKDMLEVKQDQHLLAMEDLQNQMVQLEHQLDQANGKLQLSQDSENDLRGKIESLQREHKQKEDKSAENNRKLQGDISSLKKEISVLKDSTLVGEKQRELDRERHENQDNLGLIDGLHRELEAAVHERDLLSKRILDTEKNMDQLVADKVAAERQQGKITERNLQVATQRLKDEAEKIQELEDEKKSLVVEIDDLSNWKSVYEAGHGLQAHARTQKKLIDDNRRLSVALEQMTGKLGVLMDSNGLLHQAFDRLKRETGRKSSFMYPEYELQEEMQSEGARLKAELAETEEQVSALEEENIRLRKTLKNQAGAVGEAGFKYAGMTADQLMKVNEFALRLRDGKTDLPLNDRSKELLYENKRLREEIQVRSLQVERYERELGYAMTGGAMPSAGSFTAQRATKEASGGSDDGSRGGGMSHVHGELSGLRNDMQQLMNENTKLREHVTNQQNDLMFHLHNQRSAASSRRGSVTDGKDEAPVNTHFAGEPDIVAVLIANNEHLHKELKELKEAAEAKREEGKGASHSQAGQRDTEYTGAYQTLYASISRPPTGLKKSGVNFGTLGTPIRRSTSGTALTGNTFKQTPWTPMGASGNFIGGYMLPATPTGSQLHTRAISAMNLPPEEWADEVKNLNAQLIESLEQLYEREQELEDQQTFIAAQEDSMVEIKQQLATLYFDYASRSDVWDKREKEYKADSLALHAERDDLKLRLKRTQESLDVLQREDKSSVEAKLAELSRKVIVYEVNETVLSRKFVSQSEQLVLEQQIRQRLEADFVEMETVLKKRILSLEQFKAAVGSRLGKLQGRVDTSVPQEDYLALQAELDNLREDHLTALQREVELKIYALKSQDLAREVRGMKVAKAHLQADLTAARATVANLSTQIEHEKTLTTRALLASESSVAQADLVSEMAAFRGDSGRMEVELKASRKHCALLQEQLENALTEADFLTRRTHELVKREEVANVRESEARKAALDVKLAYEGGLTRLDSENLRAELDNAQRSLENAITESAKNRELAEIASCQAQTLSSFKQVHDEELQELRKYCSKLESKGDDELLIGRLQRQLMSTKTSYKAFTRKYQILRGSVRQRDLALRVLETRLDQREAAALDLQETHRLELSAMKKAIRQITNLAVAMDGKASDIDAATVSPDGTPHNAIIKSAKKMFRGSSSLQTIGNKLLAMSKRVNDLSGLATDAVSRATEAEDKVLSLDGNIEDLHAEKEILIRKCQDLEAVAKGKEKAKAVAARLVALSDDLCVNKLQSQQAKRQLQVVKKEKQALQSIITSLHVDMEDLEHRKLVLETKHRLEREDGSDTSRKDKDSLDTTDVKAYKAHRPSLLSLSSDAPAAGKRGPDEVDGKKISFVDGKLVTEITDGTENGPASMSHEEVSKRLADLNEELELCRKDSSNSKQMLTQINHQLAEAHAQLAERDSQLAQCERVFQQEGLPPLFGRQSKMTNNQEDSSKFKLLQEDQEKLQIAATATIGSLRSLLEDKNRALEKAEAKIEELQRGRRVKSAADKHADELIEWLDATDEGFGRRKRSNFVDEGDPVGQHAKLLKQVEQADELLLQKDKTIQQLEAKLAQHNNQRERAEIRCGTAITEMEAMKQDMLSLVNQLKASEDQIGSLNAIVAETTGMPVPAAPITATPSSTRKLEKKVNDLQKLVKTKEEKLKSYRDIIIKLKEEFVKTEEENAVAAVVGMRTGVTISGNTVTMGTDELRELKSQISALRDGLRQAKDDLEKTRQGREKLVQARRAAQEEVERMESQLGRAEAQAAAAQDALMRTRKEFEETKRKEIRLREKLREMLEKEQASAEGADGSRGMQGHHGHGPGHGDQVRGIEEEAKVLRAQNIALRAALEKAEIAAQTASMRGPSDEPRDGEFGDSLTPGRGREAGRPGTDLGTPSTPSRGSARRNSLKASGTNTYVSRGRGGSGIGTSTDSKGHVLGSAGGGGSQGDGPTDEYRQQMQARWENEKKMQKRVTTLEKRLQEKIEENTVLQQQLAKARSSAQSALATQDTMQRKVNASAKLTHEARRLTVEDLTSFEDANQRVFQLEEENTQLKRKIEVEFPNEINALRQQVSSLRSREVELSREVEESEERRKRAASVTAGSGGGSRSIRESEDRHRLEDRLKNDLERARRQRLELEATLLERDATAMENRFDLVSRDEELGRLRRRVKELEAAYRAAQSSMLSARSGGGTSRSADGPLSGRGTRQSYSTSDAIDRAMSMPISAGRLSKREQELEGVVEAMKRVVDKLQGENDRLKRGGVGEDDRKLADAERRANVEKKRAEKLDAEVKSLQVKANAGDENSQKMIQKTQQIAALRRQLKTRDDEVAMMKEQLESLVAERNKLQKRTSDLESRTKQAEVAAQLANVQATRDTVGGVGLASRPTVPSDRRTAREAAEAAAELTSLREQVGDLKKRTTEVAVQNEALKAQLAEARRAAKSSSKSSSKPASSSSSGVGGGGLSKDVGSSLETSELERRLEQVTDENARLRRELSAFDLDFFEEIENLKYAHAEATRKLRMYEAGVPPRR